MKSPQEFGEYLDTLIAKAPALRAAGVLGFKGGVLGDVMLNPNAGDLNPPPPTKKEEETTKVVNPLDDPLAYGLEPGEKLPWQEDKPS